MQISWWYIGTQSEQPSPCLSEATEDAIEVLLTLTPRESAVFMERAPDERGRRMEHLLGWARAVLTDGRIKRRRQRTARQPSPIPDSPDAWLASWSEMEGEK